MLESILQKGFLVKELGIASGVCHFVQITLSHLENQNVLNSAYSASKVEARVRRVWQSSSSYQSNPFNEHPPVNEILTGSKQSSVTDVSVSDRPWKQNYLFAFVPNEMKVDELGFYSFMLFRV